MVLSAESRFIPWFGAATLVSLCVVLGGCNTTQKTAARIKIRSERTLADRKPVKVTRLASGVTALGTSVVRAGKQTAIAVELRNNGTEPVTDLPIVVESKAGGEVAVVNSRQSTWYQVHTPAIAPGEEATWVFSTDEPVPSSGLLTVRVGEATDPPTTPTDDTALEISRVVVEPGKSGSTAVAEIHNPNDFPQYNVPVFAWAKEGRRLVAAGQATVEEVSPGGTETATVKLVGDPGSANVQVLASATIFE